MCCFFRTAVTSFSVKSHSHNSHFMCRGAGPEQVRALESTRNHINSSGTCETQTNLPGHWSDVGYSVYYCSSDVCWHEASSVSSFVLFVKLQNGCFKVGCAGAERWAVIFRPRCTSTCWTLVVFDRSQVSVCLSQSFVLFFFSVIFCRKV